MEKARSACNKSHGQQHIPLQFIANIYRFHGQARVKVVRSGFFATLYCCFD
jgi:hypothetical protein